MTSERMRAEAVRDQAWAKMRDRLDDLTRIAEIEFDVTDIPLIREACAMVSAEVVYRNAVDREMEI